MNQEIEQFIEENIDLMERNTKKSWKELYNKLAYEITGKFTRIILDAGINDPASIMEFMPQGYLAHSDIEKYSVPKTVTSISNWAFIGCKSLTSVTISSSVTSIGYHAFAGCSGLTSVTIGNGVVSIDDDAFYSCDSLKEVVISDSVTNIGYRTFDSCNSLTSVTIGENSQLKSVGDYAFANCNKLTEIRFKGTKKQAIRLGIGSKARKKWRDDSLIRKIVCDDGEIIL